jgi:ABC-type polysaccharide/polyol phosphate export permease
MTDLGTQQQGAVETLELPPLVWPTKRVVRPAKRRIRLRDLVRDKAVIRVLAARDFRVKYKQSVLGPIWLVVQPAALLAAFFLAYRSVGDVKVVGIPYLPFVMVGLAVWSFFQASLTIGTSSLIGSVSFIRFTPCPRGAFPVASIIASLPAIAITGVAALVVSAVTGQMTPRVLLLPLALAWLMILTFGVVLTTSSIAVRYRDVVNALPLVLQLGVFVAPVGFPLDTLFPAVRVLVELNPLTGVIETFRWMMLASFDPSLEAIGIGLLTTTIVAVSGWRIFSRMETTMADEI